MQREEEYNVNHQSRLIATTECLSNPVEVEVTQLRDFLYEAENQQPSALVSEDKKAGFWKSIFGEKRCKACSQKKCECTCKSKKKNTGQLNRSAHGTSRGIQKNDNCSKTCPVMNQGTGCHLYFCIDSKRKKQPIKSKTNKNKHNEKIKTNVKPFPELGSDENNCEGVPNITIFCDDSKECLENPNIQTRQYLTTKTHTKPFYKDMSKSVDSNATRKFNYLTGEKAVYQFKNSEKNLFDVNTINKPKLKNIETSTENCFFANENHQGQTAHFGPVVKEDVVLLQKTIPANKQQKKYDIVDTNQLDQKQTVSEEMNKGVGVLRNFTGELHKTENIVSTVKIDLTQSFENSTNTDKKQKLHPDNELDDESLLNKEYNFGKYRKKTRKSTMKSGLFARNSLITLRRERRQSDLEGSVSLILEKLGNIENKITELEKMNSTGEKENNITMGITCEGKQSKVAIKFDNRSSKEVSANQPTLVVGSRSGDKSNKTIRITSINENIYLKTPGEVKVVRSKQQEGDPSNRSKQLIYENAYKMDAHTIGSNSTTIQCKNPKVVLSYQKPEPLCKNPQCTGKWRRISEELK